MKNKKVLAVLNFASIIGVIAYNYTVGINGINGITISDVSKEYQNLFTPASYAFSIWGLIFIALLTLGIHQLNVAFKNKDENQIIPMGFGLIIANVFNGFWIYSWIMGHLLLSVFLMLGILISLLGIIVKLRMQIYNAPNSVKLWTWIPISLYSGWITVATIANVAAYLTQIGWDGWFSEQTWTVIMLSIAFGLNVYMLLNRNMIMFALVGVWSFIAIAVRHSVDHFVIQWSAISLTLFLLGFIFFQLYKREFKLL